MKKFLVIAFTLFYFAVSAGVQVKVHYCHGKISSVKFFSIEDKSCCCKKKVNSKCCSDKVSFVKLSNDQQKISTENLTYNFLKEIAQTDFLKVNDCFVFANNFSIPSKYLPPLLCAVPRTILFAVFRM